MSDVKVTHIGVYVFDFVSFRLTVMVNVTVESPKVIKDDGGMNILGIVVFSIFLGAIISTMGDAGKPLVDFFECLHIATMKLTMLVIW